MRFITDAARLGEFADVIWAAEHYGKHYPPDPTVNLCAIIAYAGLGETTRALNVCRHTPQLFSDVQAAADKLTHLVGRELEFRRDDPQDLVDSVVAALGSKRRKARRGPS